jgi:acetone carboxylase gamma subunit
MKHKKEIKKKINDISEEGFYWMQTRSLLSSNKKQMERCDLIIRVLQWVIKEREEI